MTVLDRTTFRALHQRLHAAPHGLSTCVVLGADALALGLGGWLALRSSYIAQCLAVLPFALALLHFYLLHHECVHRSAFASERCNAGLGQVLGVVLVYPFFARRRSHLLHHAFAGHLLRDPTNARARARFASLSSGALRALDALWRLWLPFLAINERVGLVRIGLSRAASSRAARRDRVCLGLSLAGYGSALLVLSSEATTRPLVFAYGAALLLLLWLEELVNLPHHLAAPAVEAQLPLWLQPSVTHSCASVPLWSRIVLLNFNLHTAHHVFPTLPWHRLARAERALSAVSSLSVCPNELVFSLRMRQRSFTNVFAAYLPGGSHETFAPPRDSSAPARPEHQL